MPLRVLFLEPFGDGSHAAFYRGWSTHSRHTFDVLALPGFHWKWRSRHGSLTLAQQANSLVADGAKYDLIFCTSMLNLPEFNGLVASELRSLPAIVYFHENQLTYPLRSGDERERDYHFAYSQMLSLLAADEVWFNSRFHHDEFFAATRAWLRRMPDYRHTDQIEATTAKSHVCYPGIEPVVVSVQESKPALSSNVPVLGWVARWEYDKRPDLFLRAVERLIRDEISFELILLGQQFAKRPDELQYLLDVAGPRVRHSGFAETSEAYWRLLGQIDVVVSTADHEFFGIGILEAIAAGAQPVLPHRLAYPEIIEVVCQAEKDLHPPDCFYYDDADLVRRLKESLAAAARRGRDSTPRDLAHFRWQVRAQEYDCRLDDLVEQAAHDGRRG